MNIMINAVGFKADEKLEKYIMDKVSKLERIADKATSCTVTLRVEVAESLNNKVVSIEIAMPGQTLFNKKQADSFEQAVLKSVDTMRVELEKAKNS